MKTIVAGMSTYGELTVRDLLNTIEKMEQELQRKVEQSGSNSSPWKTVSPVSRLGPLGGGGRAGR